MPIDDEAGGQAPVALTDRIPGHSVIEELFRSLDETGPRSRLARILGLRPLSTDQKHWYSGALGEQVVARVLATLGPNWAVLHGVPVGDGSSDIDHVVIGPGGVYTINTKHHPEKPVWVAQHTFLVSGQKKPYIRNSEYEAKRAKILLQAALPAGLSVVPMIVIVDAKSLTIKRAPATVVVLRARKLARWLRKRPVVLDAGQAASVVALATIPATWKRDPTAETEPRVLAQRFDALQGEVGRATAIRIAWALALLIGLGWAAFAALPLVEQGIIQLFTPAG